MLKAKLSKDLHFIRGCAIFLVVIGHVIGKWPESGILQLYNSDIFILSTLYQFIYTFHVSLFFTVSGIAFSAFSNADSTWQRFITSRFKRLFIPLICWAPVTFILRSFTKETHFSSILDVINRSVIHPSFIFWFFHALIFASLLSFLFLKIFKSSSMYFYLSITLTAIVLCINLIHPFPILRDLLSYYLYGNLFYAYGLVIASHLEKIRSTLDIILPSITLLVLLLCFILMASAFCLMRKEQSFSINFLISIFNGVVASVFLYMILNKSYILPLHSRFKKLIKAFQDAIVYLGKTSMPIYLFHVHFGAIARMSLVKFIHTKSPTLHLILGVIVATIGPIILYEILKPRSRLFSYSIGESK